MTGAFYLLALAAFLLYANVRHPSPLFPTWGDRARIRVTWWGCQAALLGSAALAALEAVRG